MKQIYRIILGITLLLGNYSFATADEINREDVNTHWGQPKTEVIKNQAGAFSLYQDDGNYLLFKHGDNEKIWLAYQFDNAEKLRSTMLLTDYTTNYVRLVAEWIDEYENVDYNGVPFYNLYSLKDKEVAGTFSLTDKLVNRRFAFGFTSMSQQPGDDDDFVDLGLSAHWAKCNLGANSPESTGTFYSWSETAPKSEGYWIDNYKYSNDKAQQYVYEYFNPLRDISGTQYDASTLQLGNEWRMPTLYEINELKEFCTGETTELTGVTVFKVTGPNGNYIYLPCLSYQSQNKVAATSMVVLPCGTCLTTDSQNVITLEKMKSASKEPEISTRFKFYGYNIRPVHNK